MLAFAGLFMTSCGPEDNEFAGLTTVSPDDAIVIPGLTASGVDLIDLNTLEISEESDVQIFTLSETEMPEGVELSKAEVVFGDGTVMSTTIDGFVTTQALNDYIFSIAGYSPEEVALVESVFLYATYNGAGVKIYAGDVDLNVIPKAAEFAEYIYEIGNSQGWSRTSPLYSENRDGIYVGYAYLDGGFKFKPIEGKDDWSGDFGQDPNGEDGALIVEGEKDCQAEPGFYAITVNMVEMTYELTRIEFVDIAGNAEGGSWDEGRGIRMEYNVDEGCWEADVILTGEFKFRGNGTWSNDDGNWGGSLDNVWNGSNSNLLPETPGERVHVKFFAICNTMSHAEFSPATDPVPGDADGADNPTAGDGDGN